MVLKQLQQLQASHWEGEREGRREGERERERLLLLIIQNKQNCTVLWLALAEPITDTEVRVLIGLGLIHCTINCSKKNETMLTCSCQSRSIAGLRCEGNPAQLNFCYPAAGDIRKTPKYLLYVSQTTFSRTLVVPISLNDWATDSLVVSERSKLLLNLFLYIFHKFGI